MRSGSHRLPIPSRRQHRLLLASEVALMGAFAFERLNWFIGPGYTLLVVAMGFLENARLTR